MNTRLPLLLSLTLSIAAISTTSAQEIRLGGGYNGSNVNNAGTDRWTGRAGYQFGADIMLGNRFFVKPGIQFMVRNMNYTVATVDTSNVEVSNVEFRYTDRWLMVPVHVGVHLLDPADDHTVNAYIQAGPTALFKLNADLNSANSTVTVNPAQWYFGGGAGLEISFIFIEAGYNVAMNKLFKDNDTFRDNFDTNPKVNQLYVTAGVRLQLKK